MAHEPYETKGNWLMRLTTYSVWWKTFLYVYIINKKMLELKFLFKNTVIVKLKFEFLIFLIIQ